MNKSTEKKTSSKITKPGKTTTKAKRTSRNTPVADQATASNALIIVESPTKARTLKKYLLSANLGDSKSSSSTLAARNFTVIASGGHIRDLPKKRIGVDVEDGFKPEYEILTDKSKIAKDLKKAAKDVQDIFLATDPDREGEAIAWHISSVIKPRKDQRVWRISFHEITQRALKEALSNPGTVDMQKVDAQQARRIVDRLVGYQVSPLLWKTVTRGLSAGRVQSVALRLICEREQEINAFISVEYWSISGLFDGEDIQPLSAKLHKIDQKKVDIPDETTSQEIITRLREADYSIQEIVKSRKRRNPLPPYITSTLQQDAGRRLGLPVKRTMSIAQKLYEGIELGNQGAVGLITYMRTDSTRIAGEANQALREWIAKEYGTNYVSKTVRAFKNKKGPVQDAHEAIRPTDVSNSPKAIAKYLSPQELKVYELIWKRFVATQMPPAEIDVTTVTIGDGQGIEFRTSGQIIVFAGYLIVFDDQANGSEKSGDHPETLPTNLSQGMPLELIEITPKQHFTQPPPRFTEAGLVKELDELGIGRPSTYATIISTLLDRKYIEKQEKTLPPTDLGDTVNRILIDRFPDIFNVDFTARMEENLDRIEEGLEWLQVVEDFYTPFSNALKIANENYKELKQQLVAVPVGKKCPDCDSELVYRWSQRGKFISCSAFPKCKFAESLNPVKLVESDQDCPQCGQKMLIREGKYGRFYGCSDYPKCKGLLPFTTEHKCPLVDCEGMLRERKSKKGRLFYGCTNYPKCKFVTSDQPVLESCPQCQAPTIFLKQSKKNGDYKYCPREECNWKEAPK